MIKFIFLVGLEQKIAHLNLVLIFQFELKKNCINYKFDLI